MNREREQFQQKYEQDEQSALEEYGVSSIDNATGVIDILADESNKEGVDELVTTFIEKIEQEASAKDSLMTKGRT